MVQSPLLPLPQIIVLNELPESCFDRYNLTHIHLIRQLYGVKFHFQWMNFQRSTQEIKCESVINMEVVSLIPYTGCCQTETVYLFLMMATCFLWDPVNSLELKVLSPFLGVHLIVASNSILKDTYPQKPKKLTWAHHQGEHDSIAWLVITEEGIQDWFRT